MESTKDQDYRRWLSRVQNLILVQIGDLGVREFEDILEPLYHAGVSATDAFVEVHAAFVSTLP
jgi:hypothetical protein